MMASSVVQAALLARRHQARVVGLGVNELQEIDRDHIGVALLELALRIEQNLEPLDGGELLVKVTVLADAQILDEVAHVGDGQTRGAAVPETIGHLVRHLLRAATRLERGERLLAIPRHTKNSGASIPLRKGRQVV
jgi:hypothetical protein